jgi:hypothetical protein
MKPIYLLLIATGMVFLVSHAQGAGWVYVGTDEVIGVEWNYDLETLNELPTGIIKVWIKKEYPDEARRKLIQLMISKGLDAKRYDTLSHALNLFEINCVTRENRIMSYTVYSTDGGILHKSTIEQQLSEGWESIFPDSMAESLYEAVCPPKEKK